MRKWRDWRDGKNDKNRGKTNDLPRGTGADSQPGAPSEPQDVNFQQGAPGERRDEGSHGPSGMHVLVAKASDEEAVVDIVALHGLNGHYRKTWTTTPASGEGKNWLESFLPEQIPNARIMSYGYNSTVQFSKSVADIGTFAEQLLHSLIAKRRSKSERTRPVIFICHSLGGLVFKQVGFSDPHNLYRIDFQ